MPSVSVFKLEHMMAAHIVFFPFICHILIIQAINTDQTLVKWSQVNVGCSSCDNICMSQGTFLGHIRIVFLCAVSPLVFFLSLYYRTQQAMRSLRQEDLFTSEVVLNTFGPTQTVSKSQWFQTIHFTK